MTQLYVVSTLFGGMTVAAALDSGVLESRKGRERLLVAYDPSPVPELAAPWHRLDVARPLLDYFDGVVYLNEDLHPYHPASWKPQPDSIPLLSRALRAHWDIDSGDVELVLDRFGEPPAAAVAQVFHDAPISVLADGLMGYGPTHFTVPLSVSHRVERLVYADLLPKVAPAFLAELGVVHGAVGLEAIGAVADRLRPSVADRDGAVGLSGRALVLGQQLAMPGMISRFEEVALYDTMISQAAASGVDGVSFKPHPACPPAVTETLRQHMRSKAVDLEILESPVSVELVGGVNEARSVWSCFSAGLITLAALHALPAHAEGTRLLLERLTPYQHGSRIPVTIAHALHCDAGIGSDPRCFQKLIDAVSYCMQPRTRPDLREVAIDTIASLSDEQVVTYFKRRRLETLGLR